MSNQRKKAKVGFTTHLNCLMSQMMKKIRERKVQLEKCVKDSLN